MFGTVLTNSVTGLTLQQFAVCFGAAILCGILTALAYKYTVGARRGFLVTLAVIPAVVMSVIMLVNGNLGIGVAVAGSFSLVRFRSMPGKASDIAVIFLAMAAGLASGMGYVAYALILTICVLLCAVLLMKTGFLNEDERIRHLRITVSEDIDYMNAFQDVFAAYTGKCRLETVKTVNLGAMYQLSYEITLKDPAAEKELIDALRIRNGNLPVISSLYSTAAQEL